MAHRTVNRQPFSVPVNQTKDGFFNHTNFNGLCDNRNDVKIDQETFAETENVYVDENDVLSSRPPLIFADNEANIIEQWRFGSVGLRLYRFDTDTEYTFVFRCTTHETDDVSWILSIEEVGYNFVPKYKLVQIEEKIYIWFYKSFICFNTAGYYFEDAVKYLYLPIEKLLVNGIETDFETKNFLTDTYRRRHQYSSISSVNFEKLVGRQVEINLNSANTQNKSKYLYDIVVQKNQEKMLVYPYSPLGSNYFVDIVQTQRATVTMRYSNTLNTIEVSFDGKFFRPLPILTDIRGNPQLTKDGMWVIAFVRRGIAKCRLVAQETTDFVFDTVFTWEIDPYLRSVVYNGIPSYIEESDSNFIPVGYFETIDLFVYIFSGPSIYYNVTGMVQYLYAEWLSGTNDRVYDFQPLYSDSTFNPLYNSDDLKVHFRYVAPTLRYPNLQSVASIISQDGTLNCSFLSPVVNSERKALANNDYLRLTNTPGNPLQNNTIVTRFIHKLLSNGKDIDTANSVISSGDMVAFTGYPLTVPPVYSPSTTYQPGTLVRINSDTTSNFYICVRTAQNLSPSANPQYWRTVKSGVLVEAQYMPPYDAYTWSVRDAKVYELLLSEFSLSTTIRYIITKADGTSGTIYSDDQIILTPVVGPITYSLAELNSVFGTLATLDPNGPPGRDWTYFFGTDYVPLNIYPGTSVRTGIPYPLVPSTNPVNMRTFNLFENITHDGNTYTITDFGASVRQFDLQAMSPIININSVTYPLYAAYNVICSDGTSFDCFQDRVNILTGDVHTVETYKNSSQWFRISKDSTDTLTDKYLHSNEDFIMLPDNGELSSVITDKERQIDNHDNLVLKFDDTEQYNRNIHRLTANGIELSSAQIMSGDLVSYTKDANSERDYLRPGAFDITIPTSPIGLKSNRFIIEKGVIENGDFVVKSGAIKINDFVRLTAYNTNIVLPVGNAGNPYSYSLTIQPYVYPTVPSGWVVGDDWPTSGDWTDIQPPLSWEVGDALPIGPVKFYGYAELHKRIVPITLDSTGVWYLIDGTLWTSQVTADNIIELDEYINSEFDEEGNRIIHMRSDIPDYSAILNETFLSFVTEKDNLNLLQVTSTRRNERYLFTDEGRDLLLYLPKINEIQFSKKITNLHTLSEDNMGVFTQDEIWYIKTLLDDYGSVSALTKPVKSKIPVGCRDGSDILTALDGEAIIFTTQRGITVLSPQDFIATTEQTITYLSDNIQQTYDSFYNEPVRNAMFMPNEFIMAYPTKIKIATYKYWIMFYRHMDRTILSFDTRTNSWWSWSTPYPIKSMMVTEHLHILMQIDFNPLVNNEIHVPPLTASLLGKDFLWTDYKDVAYYDELVPNAINGDINEVDQRHKVYYPSHIIDWKVTSQRLHFNEINNYKLIKALILNVKGDATQTAKITTKAYRDFYHPEKSEVTEIKINDIRTFIQRMNLMRVINFQYTIETDKNNEQQSQLRLNSLGIKYELKERVR